MIYLSDYNYERDSFDVPNVHFLGNWDTLEVRPKERGVDTREELLKFYEENYSSNLMYLVVYAKGK